jgi:hypothetical protein
MPAGVWSQRQSRTRQSRPSAGKPNRSNSSDSASILYQIIAEAPQSVSDPLVYCDEDVDYRSLEPLHIAGGLDHLDRYQNIKIAFLASTGQMKAWLKHQKRRKEHRTQRS